MNPSKHSTRVILFLFKAFFINLASFLLNTSRICKTLPDKFFFSVRMVANKKEAPHTHLAVICSIFSSQRLYFPIRIMGHSHKQWMTKWKTRYWEVIYKKQASGIVSVSCLCHSTPLASNIIQSMYWSPPPTLVLFSTPVLCWSQVSAATGDHFGLLHSITHKTLGSDKKPLLIFMSTFRISDQINYFVLKSQNYVFDFCTDLFHQLSSEI